MKTYLVGGAVRDKLLGLKVKERDFVVVGSTVQDMLHANFKKIGGTFPVFLHPETKEEYALARTEKKQGEGHTGFICDFSPETSLEEDLTRRDLSINAIAMDESGGLIDPNNGRKDLERRYLKHISGSFSEDPLRILRVARFLAQLHEFDFSVHPDTHQLILKMMEEQVLLQISPERILQEIDKALSTKAPSRFFSYLDEIRASNLLWPGIKVDTSEKIDLMRQEDVESKLCATLAGLDEQDTRYFCERVNLENRRRDLVVLVNNEIEFWKNFHRHSAKEVVNFLERTDAFRKKDRFIKFNRVCESLTKRKLGQKWLSLYEMAQSVQLKSGDREKLKGPDFGKALKNKRIAEINRKNDL